MRRWELVGDGSAKFWEAAVEGASVRVRYGRIGTGGREQVKELASDEAAGAHFARLVAEKERKGYAESGPRPARTPDEAGPQPAQAADETGPQCAPAADEAGPQRAPAPAPTEAGPSEPAAPATAPVEEPAGLPDEDTFVLPAEWRAKALPRRSRATPASAPAARDGRGLESADLAEHQAWIDQVLAAPASDPELVRAAHAYLAGEPDALGAAAVASMLFSVMGDTLLKRLPIVDRWAAQHGPAFAALAAVEVFEVHTAYQQAGRHRSDMMLCRPRLQGPHYTSGTWHSGHRVATLVRALLAVTDEASYREAVDALAVCRTTPQRRVVTVFLAPGTPGWADECLADGPYVDDGPWLRTMLMQSLDDPAQLRGLGLRPQLLWNAWTVDFFATLADSVGTACVPLLPEAVEQGYGTDHIRAVTDAATVFPTDDAFRFLLSRLDDKHSRAALQKAMTRYPVRAVRLLAETATGTATGSGKNAPAARQLLDSHVRLHRAQLPAILPRLDSAAAELVRSMDAAAARVAEAAPEALPPVLVSPPWTRKRPPSKPRVLAGLQPDAASVLLWRDGERERWARTEHTGHEYPANTDWAVTAERVLNEHAGLWYATRLLLQGPVEELSPYVADWRPGDLWNGLECLRPVLATYGPAAVPTVLHAARTQPATLAPLLFPVLDVTAARVMADALVRLKSVQETARSWFARHGVPAAVLLVPDAVGPVGAARRAAEQALRLVAAAEGADALLAAAADRYGEEAAGILAEALGSDPWENALPARMPVLPAWLQPAVLPQLLLASGEALPDAATGHVLTMLALSKPGDPYPALAVAVDACRPDSLAALGWAMFEEWRQAAMPAKESWVLHALGVLGDDDTVRRLTPIVREWPGEGAHHRAVEGLNVLAEIGTDVALLHLHTIAQRVKFKALKQRAQEKIAEVAEELGLTGEQLSDRLVPDLGLDADGTTVVDYGPRRFTVGFDEQLRPYVLDADGKRHKELPVPGARDDRELAPAERKRFAALKKDVRAVAADQIRRLEAAMVAGRSWSATEFDELFLRHPLVRHLARRLVWLADVADAPTVAFRVAEDRTLADASDEAFALPEGASVRLAHPLHLGEQLPVWAELFADHEILQPFPQLGRPVRRLTAQEAGSGRLLRFEGVTVPVGRLLGMTKKGWERGVPQDAGVERWFSKRISDGCHLVIQLDQGIWVGVVNESPDQTFETVWLDTVPRDHWSGRDYPLRFGDLDAVAASELLADLEEMTAS
ncbi:DUF4132 domain-containing protein [Kitasatospora terrestris]|uniref:WGR domain-containing protein n=1 Tax=Kitasatospora terrestris TaxID=258051 RepID=A0ABP9D7C6_9ACTN